MTTDMWNNLGTADRSVRSDTREGQEVRVLEVEKTYAAARSEVWHALTAPERLARWLSPVTGDLALGGRYQIQGNASGTVLRLSLIHI